MTNTYRILTFNKRVEDSYFVDGTRLKIPYEIKPPLSLSKYPKYLNNLRKSLHCST